MKRIIFIGFILISLWNNANGFPEYNPKSGMIGEFIERDGLPNFITKALRGDSVKVAYLGGSITEQPGWRVLSLEWFKQRFPKANFSEIHAAIGGTGSDFGAFRLYEHVLRFNPDLVFVEFAVNDSRTAPEKIKRSMDGIVRQIWKYNSLTDICFIYTIQESFLETEQHGNLPTSVTTMETVADHYHIPSINFGYEVSKLVRSNQLIMTGSSQEINGIKVFSPDGTHAYPETGHVIYNETLKRHFETMSGRRQTKFRKHKLPKPLVTDCFSNTKMLDLNVAKLSDKWDILKIEEQPQFRSFGKYLNQIGKASQTGVSLTIRFKGDAIGAYDIMGPGAGKVIVEVDGIVKDTISRFDKYCTYWRMNYFLIDQLKNKEHEVIFKTLAQPFDKAAILKQRGNEIKNPDDFRENSWFIGKILLDGTLLSQ